MNTLTLTDAQVHEIVDALIEYECRRKGDVSEGACTLKALRPLVEHYTSSSPLTAYVIEYARIPTNYNPSQRMIVEAETASDARLIAKERLGDRGIALANYSIESVKPHEPLTARGRVVSMGGAS